MAGRVGFNGSRMATWPSARLGRQAGVGGPRGFTRVTEMVMCAPQGCPCGKQGGTLPLCGVCAAGAGGMAHVSGRAERCSALVGGQGRGHPLVEGLSPQPCSAQTAHSGHH